MNIPHENRTKNKPAETEKEDYKRQLKCKTCNKKFNFSSNLTKHKIVHTGKKPFKCNTCDKAFTQRQNMLRHQKIHTGEKAFSCEVKCVA